MTNESTLSRELNGAILRSVSRSFYLSVRLLPRELRDPVGLAYLLARATDTLADTTEVPSITRKSALEALASAIQTSGSLDSDVELAKFASLQKNNAEKNLIEAVPRCLDRLKHAEWEDRADIRVVLGKINQAQTRDVELFSEPGKVRALSRTDDLNNYTYEIAGCVGEFWTQLCFRHLVDFAELPKEEMLKMGRSYGDGLQLINILRDAGGDLRAGRCYFPEEELRMVGLDPSRILAESKRFEPIFRKWLGEAERGLESGMEYVNAIHDRRVRAATVLPALIGARTIKLLRTAGTAALETKIKVPRNEVRGLIASVTLSLASRQRLKETFRKARE